MRKIQWDGVSMNFNKVLSKSIFQLCFWTIGSAIRKWSTYKLVGEWAADWMRSNIWWLVTILETYKDSCSVWKSIKMNQINKPAQYLKTKILIAMTCFRYMRKKKRNNRDQKRIVQPEKFKTWDLEPENESWTIQYEVFEPRIESF